MAASPASSLGLDPGSVASLLLGVTGGIASGKSTVARMFEALGAFTIDFDRLGRRVVEPRQPAWKDVVDLFGPEILLPDQTLDRKKIAAAVFADETRRKKLEAILHPAIYREYQKEVHAWIAKHPPGILQAVVPLLIEAHLEAGFDRILLVYAPEEIQIQRLMAREGIPRSLALQMIRSQMPIEEKRGYAHFIIDNSGDLEETRRQVQAVWEKLKKIQEAKASKRA
jgi:dephospho-CoA kinase